MTRELKLIRHLRSDARKSLVDISKETGIPQSTIYDWLRRSNGNLIKKHTSIVDFSRLGFNARAGIIMKTDKASRSLLHNYLAQHENVNSAFRINHDFDFMADCIFRDIKELEDFVEGIKEKFPISKMNVHQVIDELKEEGFLADKDSAMKKEGGGE